MGAWLGGLFALGLTPAVYRAEPMLFGPVHLLLLGMALVVVPLSLALTVHRDGEGRACPLHRTACVLWPVAATAMAASFLLPAGRTAGLLAVPWLLFSALCAGVGGLRFYRRRGQRLRIAPLCIDIGLLYLLFAARWLFLCRAGIPVPRVPELFVALTAVHFHYTFFAATLIMGLLGLSVAEHRSAAIRYAYRAAALSLLGGPPLVATGINRSLPGVELGGVALIVISLCLLAGLTAFVAAPAIQPRPVRRLLQLASLALPMAMACAAYFAYAKYAQRVPPTLEGMIRSHGLLNALFVVGSLAGWYLVDTRLSASDCK